MGRLDRYTPAAVFALAFVLYAVCAYPSFAPRDAADLALAAARAGVAHPPGYPLYAFLGRAWLWALRLGGRDYRLNLMSAASGALAAALLARACLSRGRAAAWSAAAALAFSAPVWKFSLLEEMYAPQAAFLAALLALSEGERASFAKRAAASGLVFGLGCVNHQTLALTAPAWLWLWRHEARRHGLPLARALAAAAPLAAAGLLLYLAVPLRLESWKLGWAVLTRREYGSFTLSGTLAKGFGETWLPLLRYFFGGTTRAVGPAACAAAAIGLAWPMRPGRRGAVVLGMAAAAGFVVLTRFDPAAWLARSVLESAFVAPAFWIAVAVADGAAALSDWKGAAGWMLAAALAVSPGLAAVAARSRRSDFAAWDYALNLKRTLPPGSVALVRGDTALFSLHLENQGRGESGERLAISELEPDAARLVALQRENGHPAYAVGLPPAAILGSAGLEPACVVGLALSFERRDCLDRWPLYAIRPFDAEDSYDRDPARAYAFARSLRAAGRFAGKDAEEQAAAGAAWDRELFRLSR